MCDHMDPQVIHSCMHEFIPCIHTTRMQGCMQGHTCCKNHACHMQWAGAGRATCSEATFDETIVRNFDCAYLIYSLSRFRPAAIRNPDGTMQQKSKGGYDKMDWQSWPYIWHWIFFTRCSCNVKAASICAKPQAEFYWSARDVWRNFEPKYSGCSDCFFFDFVCPCMHASWLALLGAELKKLLLEANGDFEQLEVKVKRWREQKNISESVLKEMTKKQLREAPYFWDESGPHGANGFVGWTPVFSVWPGSEGHDHDSMEVGCVKRQDRNQCCPRGRNDQHWRGENEETGRWERIQDESGSIWHSPGCQWLNPGCHALWWQRCWPSRPVTGRHATCSAEPCLHLWSTRNDGRACAYMACLQCAYIHGSLTDCMHACMHIWFASMTVHACSLDCLQACVHAWFVFMNMRAWFLDCARMFL